MIFHLAGHKSRWLPVIILLVAFAFRIVALDRLPPGFSHDEAYNGVTAIQVLQGQRLIFFEINKGIEPLIIYLEALAFAAFGIGPVPVRLVNVACGMLSVALIYPLACRLFNRQAALLAMIGLAISFWAIFIDRLTLRAVTLPPLLILTLYFLWRGLTDPHLARRFSPRAFSWFVLAGLAAGATMYTYLSSRFMPLLILAIFGYRLVQRQISRWHGLGFIVVWLLWAALFAPLAGYYLEHADSFTHRADQVSTLPYLLNGEAKPLVKNTLLTLGMFIFHGDDTDRYNLDGRPVFDPLNGLFFYLGLAVILLRLRRPSGESGPAALLLLWIFWMLLPDFITDDSPHLLRTIGAMPATYLFWAIGLITAWDWATHRLHRRQHISGDAVTAAPQSSPGVRHPRRFTSLARSLLVMLLLLTALHTGYDYFGRWAAAPGAQAIYGADIAEIANFIKHRHNTNPLAISAEYYRDLDPFRLALHFQGQPPFAVWFDGRQTLAFPPRSSGYSPDYIFPASAPPAKAWLSFLQPVPAESGRKYTLYRLPDHATRQQDREPVSFMENRLNVNVNDDLALLGYQLLGSVISGGKFQVLLGWQALRRLPPGTDYTFVVRLQDNQGHEWARADGNGYAPADWQPGVLGLQLLTLRLPGDLPRRAYHLTVEVVDRQAGRALPAVPGGETVTKLTPVEARLAATPRLIDVKDLPNPLPADPAPQNAGTTAAGPVLRGYQIQNSAVSAGQSLSLVLHWQVLEPPRQDYRLQLFLTGPGAVPSVPPAYRWPSLAPIGGEWPTSQWPAGYWVQDRLDLPVGREVPPGSFELWLAWVGPETAPAASGLATASAWSLGTVKIAR